MFLLPEELFLDFFFLKKHRSAGNKFSQLSFVLNVFILAQYLEYIVVWQLFSFSILKMLLQCLPAATVSVSKLLFNCCFFEGNLGR